MPWFNERLSFLRGPLAFLLLGTALLALYWMGLNGGFFFDDAASILYGRGVRLEQLSVESLLQIWGGHHGSPFGRPLSQLSFALNYYFSGFDPFFFKLTNLGVHLLNAALVYLLADFVLVDCARTDATSKHPSLPIVIAAMWALHPIQLLPVLHVVQRMTSLSALFMLAAMLLHIKGRERAGRKGGLLVLLGWLIFFPLSCLSKETGVLFPLFVLLWEVVVNFRAKELSDPWGRRIIAAIAISALMASVFAMTPAAGWLWSGYSFRSFSMIERLMTEARVLWFYLGQIMFPRLEVFGIYHDDFVVSRSLLSPWTTLPALLGLLGLVWIGWWQRTKRPLVTFGVAWFLVGHALESTILPLELVHEHRNYVPLFGAILVLVGAGRQLLSTVAFWSMVGAFLAYSAFVTGLRAHQFGDEGRRTQIEAQHHRSSSRAQYEAGLVLASQQEAADRASATYSLASRHYQLSSELDGDFKYGFLGEIHLNCKAGVLNEQTLLDEFSSRLRERAFAPGDRNILYGMKEMAVAGTLCLSRKEMDVLFRSALANRGMGNDIRALIDSWYADYLWLREGDHEAAVAALKAGLEAQPGSPSIRLKLAQLYYLSGSRAAAYDLLRSIRHEIFSADEKKALEMLLINLKQDEAGLGKS